MTTINGPQKALDWACEEPSFISLDDAGLFLFLMKMMIALRRSTMVWFYGLRRFQDSKRMHKMVIKGKREKKGD